MRVVVLPKNLEVGGTQVNSIDLSNRLAAMGYEVVVASQIGPLSRRIDQAMVRFEAIPPAKDRIPRLRSIRRLLGESGADVVHAYEARGVMDASIASSRGRGVPVLGTIMSTRVPWYLPETVPLTVGTPALHDYTNRWRTGLTTLLEPPVPSKPFDDAGAAPQALQDLQGDGPLIVLVSRLVLPFKREGILRSISAMHQLGRDGFRLLIVGDGPARSFYERAADAANAALESNAVAFAGMLDDPFPAYDAADVVIGNGVSVVQGAMMAKPAVVIGREGFSTRLTRASLDVMIEQGFYGVGLGTTEADPLVEQIMEAAGSPAEEPATVAALLEDKYGLHRVASRLSDALRNAADLPPVSRGDMVRSLARLGHYRARRYRLRVRAVEAGLIAEEADNYVYGRLRDLALPPGARWTGRNKTS